MVRVSFTSNIQSHVRCPPCEVQAGTIKDVLDAVFADNSTARRYVLDDQGAVRKHMTVFVNGQAIRDRLTLSDSVGDGAEVFIMQALSGG